MTRSGMRSGWLGRRGGRVVAAAILALACAGSTVLANVRAAADVCLLGVSPVALAWSPHSRLEAGWGWPGRTQMARLEFGAEVTDNVGITAGAMLAEAWGQAGAFYAVSGLPVTVRAYWDFTPNELWARSTAYVSATYYHDNFYGDPSAPTSPPCLALAVGATYTYYVLTARTELLVPAVRSPGAVLFLGVELGGSYILGPHHEPDFVY
jgi:hypothetical protein